MSVDCDPPQASQASAFSNGKDQVISNAAVLNATRDIIIYGAPQSNVPQTTPESSFLQKLFSLAADFFTHSLQETSRREMPQIESALDYTDVNLDDDDDNESVRSYDSDVTLISVTPSYNKEFIPLEAFNRGPSSCGTYIEEMFPLKFGYPLWLPQPDHNLPVDYRRKGISIGDVGVITTDGGFDFLFNIWLPADDPIHPDDLPDDFDSVPRPKLKTSFQPLFTSGSKVSSLDIESHIDVNTNDISYTCKNGNKGAILSLPDGASQENLKNESDLKDFVAKNALSWYRYALQNCGRDIDRHSLYLITGCTKSKTWGIATFDKDSEERHSLLVIGESRHPNDPSHIWKQSGGATTFRSGPSPDPGLCIESSVQAENQNQTLFLRGFKMSLSEDAWNSIRDPVNVVISGKDEERQSSSDKLYGHKSRKEPLNDGNASGVYLSESLSSLNLCHDISISHFPAKTAPFHPLNAINDILLSQYPEAHIAITHDNLWCEITDKGEYDVEKLQESIQSHYVVDYCKETGACTLNLRVDSLMDINLDHPGSASDESAFIDALPSNAHDSAIEGILPSSLFSDTKEESEDPTNFGIFTDLCRDRFTPASPSPMAYDIYSNDNSVAPNPVLNDYNFDLYFPPIVPAPCSPNAIPPRPFMPYRRHPSLLRCSQRDRYELSSPQMLTSEDIIPPSLSTAAKVESRPIFNLPHRYTPYQPMHQVVSSIEYLHECRSPIVHGDIKAANIIVNDQIVYSLADFGRSSLLVSQRNDNHRHGHVKWQTPECNNMVFKLLSNTNPTTLTVGDIMNSIANIHRRHLVHGDIKATNFALTKSMAKQHDVGASGFHPDVVGRTIPRFLIPEQLEKDIYSIAVLRILLGYPSCQNPLRNFLMELKTITPELWEVIKQCWSEDVNESSEERRNAFVEQAFRLHNETTHSTDPPSNTTWSRDPRLDTYTHAASLPSSLLASFSHRPLPFTTLVSTASSSPSTSKASATI